MTQPQSFAALGRRARVAPRDTGAELTWSEGVTPIYYEQIADALLAARLWTFHGIPPTRSRTLVSQGGES